MCIRILINTTPPDYIPFITLFTLKRSKLFPLPYYYTLNMPKTELKLDECLLVSSPKSGTSSVYNFDDDELKAGHATPQIVNACANAKGGGGNICNCDKANARTKNADWVLMCLTFKFFVRNPALC